MRKLLTNRKFNNCKNKLLSLITLLLTVVNIFSQVGVETRAAGKSTMSFPLQSDRAGSVDCKCNNNILKDGGFETVIVSGPKSNITSISPYWKDGEGTPQWTSPSGPCNKGTVKMWGNKTVGESIYQNGILLANRKQYVIRITARHIYPTNIATFVRLKIFGYTGIGRPNGYDAPGVVSDKIGQNWETFSVSITGAGQTSIALHPENDFTEDDGSKTSVIEIDNICIEELCVIPASKCAPQFTAAPFIVNSQGNILVHVNPVVTSGASHYWGLMRASSLNDNAPLPLADIIAGKTFGLGVSSTGVATPIGMGTGIYGSTSGYGYYYEGVPVGICFKITHYIQCCDKWYSQTNTYCTKLCTEAKENVFTRGQGLLPFGSDSPGPRNYNPTPIGAIAVDTSAVRQ